MKAHIASGHQLASQAGARILKLGGNAFDAAVAGGFAQCVVEPLLSGLGGGGYMLAKQADNSCWAYDFFVDFPGRGQTLKAEAQEIVADFLGTTQKFKIGEGSVTVPGTIEGLLHCHRELGHCDLKTVLQPAIEYAKAHRLNKAQATVIFVLDAICSAHPEGRKLYYNLVNKKYTRKQEGETMKNPLMAQFLQGLADQQHQAFKEPQLVEKICTQTQAYTNLNADDFKQYQVLKDQALKFKYRDFEVYTTPPPNVGGELLKKLLQDLEQHNLSQVEPGSSQHLLIVAKILKQSEGADTRPFKKGTTHLSVSDAQGCMASLSLSNGEGSGYFAPGTGIMLNNMMGEDDVVGDDWSRWQVGTRMPSRMSPLLLKNPQGQWLALGTGGSRRIRSSLFMVVSNIVDFSMHLAEAVQAPRMNWDGQALQIEPGFDAAAVQELQQHLPVNEWDHLGFFFGGVHSVAQHELAVGDPRRDGWGCDIG